MPSTRTRRSLRPERRHGASTGVAGSRVVRKPAALRVRSTACDAGSGAFSLPRSTLVGLRGLQRSVVDQRTAYASP
jgi:hypothetical protein